MTQTFCKALTAEGDRARWEHVSTYRCSEHIRMGAMEVTGGVLVLSAGQRKDMQHKGAEDDIGFLQGKSQSMECRL